MVRSLHGTGLDARTPAAEAIRGRPLFIAYGQSTTLTYPAGTGRHFRERLRVIDSLQLTAEHQVATPAD
ncbi:hypothetical protein ACWCQS_41815 [Streptomyces sp. NPDC002076]